MNVHFVGILAPESIYFDTIFTDGSSAFSHALDLFQEFLNGSFAEKHSAAVSIIKLEGSRSADIPGWIQCVEIQNTVAALLQALLQLTKSGNKEEAFCLTWLDNVFQQKTIYEKALNLHNTYRAHYTYVEGYPTGISPECFSSETLSLMNVILNQDNELQQKPVNRNSFFDIIKKRIHDFDIEADLAPEDMRLYRLELTANTRRNFVLSKQLWEGGLRSIDALPEFYQKKPELFIGPGRYYYVQLSNQNDKCIYSPYPIVEKEEAHYIDSANYKKMLDALAKYSPESHIALGLAGEVATHPNIAECLLATAQRFRTVYVETNGRYWDRAAPWWNEDWIKNLQWIIFLDSLDEALYSEIHGGNSNREALLFLQFLAQKTEPSRIYLQCTRMTENEGEIIAMDKFCKAEGYQFLVQKYNSYCGLLSDRTVVDLRPHKRFPCRHLERDMLVLTTGDVMLCTQDIAGKHCLGNIFNEDIETIQKKRERFFAEQAQEAYKELCNECDEYYTVNA